MGNAQAIEDAIHHALAGLNLHAADIALDEARRKLWCAAITGTSSAAASTPEIEAAAVRIAELLDGVPLANCVEPLEGTRLRVWLQSFGATAAAALAVPRVGDGLNA